MRFEWGVTLGFASPRSDGEGRPQEVVGRLAAEAQQAGVDPRGLFPLRDPAAAALLGAWFDAAASLDDAEHLTTMGFALGRGLAYPGARDDGIGVALRWASRQRLGNAMYGKLAPLACAGSSGRAQVGEPGPTQEALSAVRLARAALPRRQAVLQELVAAQAEPYSLSYALRAGEACGMAGRLEDPRKQASRCLALCYRSGLDPRLVLAARAQLDDCADRAMLAPVLGALLAKLTGTKAALARLGVALGRMRGSLVGRLDEKLDPGDFGPDLGQAHEILFAVLPAHGLDRLLAEVGWNEAMAALKGGDRAPATAAAEALFARALVISEVLEAGCTRLPALREHVLAGYRASIAANLLSQVPAGEDALPDVQGALRTAHYLELSGLPPMAELVRDAAVRCRFVPPRQDASRLAWGPPSEWQVDGIDGQLRSSIDLGLVLSQLGRTRPDDSELRSRVNAAVAHASDAGLSGSAAHALGELAFEVRTTGAQGLDLDAKVRDAFEQLPRAKGHAQAARRGRAARLGARLGWLSRALERSHGGADVVTWIGGARHELVETLGVRFDKDVEQAWARLRAPALGLGSTELLSGRRADAARGQLVALAELLRGRLDAEERPGFEAGHAVKRMALDGLPRSYADEMGRGAEAIRACIAAGLPGDVLAELGAAIEDALSDAEAYARRVCVAPDLSDQLEAARQRALSCLCRWDEDERAGESLWDADAAATVARAIAWPSAEARTALPELPQKIAMSTHDPEWGRLVTSLVPPHPLLRALAVDVAARLPGDDPVLQAAALFEAVRHHCKYVRDPGEFVHPPLLTIAGGGGDCEDLAVLLAALLSASGIPAALVWQPGHMIAAAYLPAVSSRCPFPGDRARAELAGYAPLDPTLPGPFVTNTSQLVGYWRVDPWDPQRPVIQGRIT